MRWRELDREACSVARTLSVVGDRWTLLVLRDCFLRVRRFEDFERRLGITRHVLADRLRKLVRAGVLERVAYRKRPARFEYRLTAKGLDLHPVLLAIVHFGDVHLAGRRGRPLLHEHAGCGRTFDPTLVCSACAQPLRARDVRVRPGPGLPRTRRARLFPAPEAAPDPKERTWPAWSSSTTSGARPATSPGSSSRRSPRAAARRSRTGRSSSARS